tara:strand:+ start:1448 stop:2077 length:630 start_codon:yes stop_codon:yes gene_type:complete
MRDQETPNRRKLSLGIDAIGTVDTILCWDKLEKCFGNSFRFSTETKFEITKELALQQGRLHKLKFEKMTHEMVSFQENARNLFQKIEVLVETKNSKALSFVSDIIKKATGSEIRAFCDALKALGSMENAFEPVRPNDLFRDIIRRIVKILLKEDIPLSLHVQSTLNKFMNELDRQLPETIFPLSNARYIEEGRIRILKDYLRGYLRNNN